MDSSEIQVELPCVCGGSVVARGKDAGGSVRCRCGRSVAVPKLSQLRALSGGDPYVTNPAEAIRKAQRNGTDPAGNKCVLCGSSAPVFYKCHAVCETMYVKPVQDDSSDDVVGAAVEYFIVGPLYRMLFRRSGSQDAQVLGHDVEVTLSLPVCDSCAAANGNVTRASVAKRLMMNVPEYRGLLAFYPDAKIRVERP